MNQNVQGLSGDYKLEKNLEMIIMKCINGYCLQETWKLGTYTKIIRDHIILHHGMEEKNNNKGRVSSGVTIILGPELLQDWTRAGKTSPIISPSNS